LGTPDISSRDTKRRADAFLAECVARLRKTPFSAIAAWPNYPAAAPVDLQIPGELSRYKFTLMKDTLPTGELRVAVQRYRHRFLGMGEMTADGFVAAPDGSTRPLTDQDKWDLT
jgi:hypothetical protein